MTAELVAPGVHQQIMEAVDRVMRMTCARDARDPVIQPTIIIWLEAMGIENPRFTT